MKQKDMLVGLDIGTTSTIGLVARVPGEILAVKSLPVTLSSPHAGWAEEDPRQWWSNAVSILRELTSGIDAERIAGICVTGMLPAVVLLDDKGDVLRPSIQQSDGRCGREVAELTRELDEAVFLSRTGNGINQQLVAAKLRWVARNEPDVFARVGTVFGSYDYINWRLTGTRAVEQNWALEAGFTDLASGAIADDLVALAGIPRRAIPPRTVSHEVMGTVSAQAARETGLPAGTPVMGGAADHIVSALGAGIANPGDVLLKFGGAGDIVVATDRALPDPRLYLDYHLVPGLFAPNGCMASSGSALNWMTTLIAPDRTEQRPHAELDRIAATVPAGSDGLLCLPYFLGEKTPIHDPLARGSFVGMALNHGRSHMWRALLEAVAYGFRHHVDVLKDIGHAPARFYASDGGTNSRLWMRIMADVLGEPMQLLSNHHGSSLGAAFVAAIGTGLETDWKAVGAWSPRGEAVLPDPATHRVYERGYARYRSLYETLAPWFHEAET